MHSNDHEIKIGDTTKGLKLIRNEDGSAMYQVLEEVPRYREPLLFTQTNWIDGHGQHDFRNPDAYFEGQSIDTTHDGRVFLGPLLQEEKDDQDPRASIGAAPVCYCWFPAEGKLLCATATSTWFLDAGGWNSSTNTVANITQMVVFGTNVYAARSAGNYYYSADGDTWSDGGDTANGFFCAPNPAGTAEVLWRFETPNKISSSTDGTTWESDVLVGDAANDITNIFLSNDNLLVGKEDGLYHYDSDGGLHQLRPDLRRNTSSDNFKYVTEWQAGIYHSEIESMGEITSYNAYEPMGPLHGLDDIGRRGSVVGLAADKNWIYVAIKDDATTPLYTIYKGREVRKGGELRWQWCPFIYLGSNATATLAVIQHSATVRKLWFGYGDASYYVILSDNPTDDSTYKFCASGYLRMSYDYGTDSNWDKLWQSTVLEVVGGASGETVQIKYRKDAETTATECVAAAITNGIFETNFTPTCGPISSNRIQFEIHLASDTNTATPEASFFQAKGVEKPTTVRMHEATYTIGSEPSKSAETIRTFLRGGRTSTMLMRFADLRYGETTGGTAGTDYVYCVLEPGSPTELEILHTKGDKPELGIRVRLREISYTE